MEDFCFSTRSKYESELMYQWCLSRELHPTILSNSPLEHTLKVSGLSRKDSRFVALLVQLTRIPGAWHFDEECPS